MTMPEIVEAKPEELADVLNAILSAVAKLDYLRHCIQCDEIAQRAEAEDATKTCSDKEQLKTPADEEPVSGAEPRRAMFERLKGIEAQLTEALDEYPLLEEDEPAALAEQAKQLAARRLHELEQQSERLPFDEIAKYLRDCQYKVLRIVGADHQYEDEFLVSHSWAEKGVRHAWAREKLSAWVMFDAEGNE